MTLRDLLHITLITSALFATALQARADAYDDGMEAYQSSNYEEAVKQWQPLAEHGNAQAAYNLGFMYEFGYGVAMNDNESFKWYLRAAQLGHVQAQRSVAWMYERGKGVPQDRAQAAHWIEVSALESSTNLALEQHFLDELTTQMIQAAARYDSQQNAGASFKQELDASNSAT